MAWREITVDYVQDPLQRIVVTVNPRINLGPDAHLFDIDFREYVLYKRMEDFAYKNMHCEDLEEETRDFFTRAHRGKLRLHRGMRDLEVRHGARVRRALKECFLAIASAPARVPVVLQFLGHDNIVQRRNDS